MLLETIYIYIYIYIYKERERDKLLVLEKNSWSHKTVNKLLLSRKELLLETTHIQIISIREEYLKP